MVRFIHAADLHMDRPFGGLASMHQDLALDFSQLNLQVLTNIVDLALRETVDFLLLVGDTFHEARPSLITQHHFINEMQRLNQAGIPVYLSFGNHDYFEEKRYWFTFPENVHIFPDEQVQSFKAQTKTGETYEVTGFSYTHPTLGHMPQFPAKTGAHLQIGMYHGDRQGTRYAPFTVEALKRTNYDYWALGHIHVPTQLSQQPLICYPGAPQGHTIKETQSNSVLLVTGSSGTLRSQAIPVAEVTWQDSRLSLKDCPDLKAATTLMQQYQNKESVQPTLLRLTLQDTAHLARDFQQAVLSGELQDYLNSQVIEGAHPTLITELVLTTAPAKEPIQLPATDRLVQQLLADYGDEGVLLDILASGENTPILGNLLRDATFQKDLIQATHATITQDFSWGDD